VAARSLAAGFCTRCGTAVPPPSGLQWRPRSSTQRPRTARPVDERSLFMLRTSAGSLERDYRYWPSGRRAGCWSSVANQGAVSNRILRAKKAQDSKRSAEELQQRMMEASSIPASPVSQPDIPHASAPKLGISHHGLALQVICGHPARRRSSVRTDIVAWRLHETLTRGQHLALSCSFKFIIMESL
jgi:hypothetical protein